MEDVGGLWIEVRFLLVELIFPIGTRSKRRTKKIHFTKKKGAALHSSYLLLNFLISISMLANVARRELIRAAPSSIASCSYSTTSSTIPAVALSQLPSTVTHADIRNLCFKGEVGKLKSEEVGAPKRPMTMIDKDGFEKSSKRRPEEFDKLSISSDIIDIRLQRSSFLNHTGKAIVSFRTAESAAEYQRLASFSIVGGSTIRAHLYEDAKEPTNLPPPIKLLRQAQKESPGRVVLLKGLPSHLTEARLTRILRSTYLLADDYTHTAKANNANVRSNQEQEMPSVIRIRNLTPVESTSSFLVRLRTVSDAMRLVRKWHRAKWDHSSGLGRVTTKIENEKKREETNGLDEDYGNDEVYQKSLTNFRRHIASFSEPKKPKEEKLWKIPLIIDAILMY